MTDSWRHKLMEVLQRKGLNMKEASIRAGLGDTAVYDIVKRGRDAQMSTMIELAKAHDFSLDELVSGTATQRRQVRNVAVYGQVAAGLWFDDGTWDEAKYADIPVVEGRYGHLEQKAYKVVGDSVDKLGIVDGSYVITVDYWKVRDRIQDNDLVVVQREDAGKIERTVKVVSILPDEYRLEPRSNNPRWDGAYISIPRPNGVDADDRRVEIMGLVIGMHRSFI